MSRRRVIVIATYNTEAVIIGVKNWGEADKMITLLSPTEGKINATAFGCRRPKSALAGALQLFNVVDIQLSRGDRIDTVRTCTMIHHHKEIISDFNATAYAAFVAELVDNLSIESYPQPDLYHQLRLILTNFGKRNPRLVALAAALQILEKSGMQMSFNYCVRSGQFIEGNAFFNVEDGGAVSPECRQNGDIPYSEEVREFILLLKNLDWELDNKFKISGKILMEAERIMLMYLHSVVEQPMKSLEFLSQL